MTINLDEIRKRNEERRSGVPHPDFIRIHWMRAVGDINALIAEVERLTAFEVMDAMMRRAEDASRRPSDQD